MLSDVPTRAQYSTWIPTRLDGRDSWESFEEELPSEPARGRRAPSSPTNTPLRAKLTPVPLLRWKPSSPSAAVLSRSPPRSTPTSLRPHRPLQRTPTPAHISPSPPPLPCQHLPPAFPSPQLLQPPQKPVLWSADVPPPPVAFPPTTRYHFLLRLHPLFPPHGRRQQTAPQRLTRRKTSSGSPRRYIPNSHRKSSRRSFASRRGPIT